MFQDLGFEPQALLPDFVRDGAGEFHDLMVLTLHARTSSGTSATCWVSKRMAS